MSTIENRAVAHQGSSWILALRAGAIRDRAGSFRRSSMGGLLPVAADRSSGASVGLRRTCEPAVPEEPVRRRRGRSESGGYPVAHRAPDRGRRRSEPHRGVLGRRPSGCRSPPRPPTGRRLRPEPSGPPASSTFVAVLRPESDGVEPLTGAEAEIGRSLRRGASAGTRWACRRRHQPGDRATVRVTRSPEFVRALGASWCSGPRDMSSRGLGVRVGPREAGRAAPGFRPGR
jgi:hypothetical protein